jgi:hypothetical protein
MSGKITDQLRPHCIVRNVLPNDQRATSYVKLGGFRLGSLGVNCDGRASRS